MTYTVHFPVIATPPSILGAGGAQELEQLMANILTAVEAGDVSRVR